jgi:hypothetical protein
MVIPVGHIKQANMGLMLLPDPRPSHFGSIKVEFSPHRSALASDLPDANGNIHPKGCGHQPDHQLDSLNVRLLYNAALFFVPSLVRIHEG